ncbi:MAG: hypothetical protein AAF387_13075, partial [Pseudomonadota bacterium]
MENQQNRQFEKLCHQIDDKGRQLMNCLGVDNWGDAAQIEAERHALLLELSKLGSEFKSSRYIEFLENCLASTNEQRAVLEVELAQHGA